MDIFEGTTVTLEAQLVDGVPSDNRAQLCIKRRGADLAPEIRAVSKPGEIVRFEHLAEAVADDEESYPLVCIVVIETKTYARAEYTVWPTKATVQATDKATSSACAGFRFQVVQNLAPSATIYATEVSGVSKPFPLEKGAFTIQPAPPWAITAEPVATGRKREVTVEQLFEVEFTAPVAASYTEHQAGKPERGLRQYVNLDTARDGQDSFGHTLKLLVGVKGDRPKAQGDRVGIPARKAYVKITFENSLRGENLVRRNVPKRELLAAGVTNLVEVAPEKTYTGEIFFTQPDELATFTLELGRTGGDMCRVAIGSTPACGDALLRIRNWRRIYYELMAYDTQGLNDLPPATIAALKDIGESVALEYALDQMHLLPEATAPAYTIMPKSFVDPMNHNVGTPPRLVCLTPSAPFAGFARAKGKRSIALWLCDALWSAKGPRAQFYDQRAVTLTPRFGTVQGNNVHMWYPRADLRDDNLTVTWTADVDKSVAFEHATVAFVDVPQVDVAGANHRSLIVQGPAGAPRNVRFEDGTLGIATALNAAARLEIYGLADDAEDYATLHAANNVAPFTITADASNSRKRARIAAIKTALQNMIAGRPDFGISRHPGIDADGDPREGDLTMADLDLARSGFCVLGFNLPAANAGDPGSFVGQPTNNTCPILLDIAFLPHVPIGGGAKRDEPDAFITVLTTEGFTRRDAETAVIIAHELGHKMKMSAHGKAPDALAPGLPRAAAVDEVEARYPENGALGHVYVAKGHQGAHCAHGFSDLQKARPTYPEGADADADCLMFGRVNRGRDEFCDQCADYIRALDLTDIEKSS